VNVSISGLDDTQVYRLGYQLRNSENDIIPISLKDTEGNVRSPGAKYTYTENLQSTLTSLSKTLYLIPDSGIPIDDYTVAVILEYDQNQQDLGFTGKQILLNNLNPISSAFEFRLWSKAFDLYKNTKLAIDSVQPTRNILFTGIDGFDSIPVNVDLRALRYDADTTLSTSVAAAFSAVLVDAAGNDVAATISLDDVTFATSATSNLSGIGASAGGGITHSTTVFARSFFVRPTAPVPTSTQIKGIRFSVSHNDSNGFGVNMVAAVDVAGGINLFISDSQLRSGTTTAQIKAIGTVSAPSISGDTASVAVTDMQIELNTGHNYFGAAGMVINGDQVTELTTTLPLTPPSTPDTAIINGILIERGSVGLTSSGAAMSGGEVRLPRGLGWSRFDSNYYITGNVLENRLKIVGTGSSGTIPLNGQLIPSETTLELVHPSTTPATPVPIALNEESKPFVWITEAVQWSPSTGQMNWNATNVLACHNDEWDILEEISNPTDQSSYWKLKRDNRSYLRKPRIPAFGSSSPDTVTVQTRPGGDAALAAFLELLPTDYIYPQTPMGSTITWSNDVGQLAIYGDQMSGSLTGVTHITQLHHRGGIDDDCLTSTQQHIFTLLPADNQTLHITPDGGLLSPALLFNTGPGLPPVPDLGIGNTIDKNGATVPVHTIGGWTDNSIDYLMAGVSLPGFTNWYTGAVAPSLGVSTLLNTGYSLGESDNIITERPGTTAYAAGTASYPGLNFHVSRATGNITGHTYLGDARIPASGEYDLRPNSKYYVRLGGVSGAHDVDFSGHEGLYLVYGYELDFSRFGLAYLNNLNAEYGLDSTVAANLQFSSAPLNGFSLAFDSMSVTGGGDLQSGDLLIDPENPKEQLSYWGGAAIPRSFNFNAKVGAACDKIRLLVLGAETYAALIDSPLHGYLAIASTSTPGSSTPTGLSYSNGSLVSLKDAAAFENTRARIFLPGLVQMRGPATTVSGRTDYEYYPIRPVADAYFNNYDTPDRPDTGFIAFGATMGVAFFEDLKIHVRTPAAQAPDSTTSNTTTVYLSGGWTDGSNSFWNHPEGEDFDAAHKGWDGDFDPYWTQNHESAQYNIVAKQEMFGLIEISYPVQWNPALRQFTGNKQAVDLLVINANHKLDFLTAERASITFGVKAEMDGIPNINLGSIAMNATGAADGILATLSKTASAQIGIILDEGTSAINSLLNDVPEQIFSQVWDSAIEPQLVGLTVPSIPSFTLIDDIIQQLDTASADLEEVTNTLQSYLLPSEQDWFFNIATEAMQNLEQTQSVIRQVDAKLAQAQNGIRSITSFSVSDLSPESVWSDTVEVLQGDGTVLNIKWEDLSEKAISEF
jgi:hypothetical protein